MTDIEGVKLFNIYEAADKLGVSSPTNRRYIKIDRLRGIRIGRPILISDEAIKESTEEAQ